MINCFVLSSEVNCLERETSISLFSRPQIISMGISKVLISDQADKSFDLSLASNEACLFPRNLVSSL